MKQAKLTAVLWREGRQFVSKCPELGVASCGDSIDEALKNLKEAVELFLENAKALGMLSNIRPPIEATDKFTTSFNIAIP